MVLLEERDHTDPELAQLCQALILELRRHFQGLAQDFPRPAEVLLLEGDLAQLL